MTRPAFLETYEYDDDELDDGTDFAANCPAFWDGERWHCPEAGSESCDIDCPHSG